MTHQNWRIMEHHGIYSDGHHFNWDAIENATKDGSYEEVHITLDLLLPCMDGYHINNSVINVLIDVASSTYY